MGIAVPGMPFSAETFGASTHALEFIFQGLHLLVREVFAKLVVQFFVVGLELLHMAMVHLNTISGISEVSIAEAESLDI